MYCLIFISYSYSNLADYYQVPGIIYVEKYCTFYSYGCGSQTKANASSGHIFHARPCVRRDHPSEVMEMVYCCTQRGRSHISQVGVGELLFHHQAMSDDIDDI